MTQEILLTGDVTNPSASFVTTIANDAVTNAKMANMATASIKGRVTAATGDPEDLSAAQAWSVLGAMPAANEPAHTGDVTNSAGSLALAIPAAAGASIEAALQARSAAQRSAHLAAMGTSFTDAQKQAVQDALLDSWLYAVLTSNYTLDGSANLQKAFNIGSGSGGALTLPTGFFKFETTLYITSMSGTSGNALFDILGAGTATIINPMMDVTGLDVNTPSNAAAKGGVVTPATATVASMVAGATGTGLGVTIHGTFNISVAGSIIPSLQPATAAAMVINANSSFRCRRIGPTGSNTRGTWT